jgi:hypothetical protein
MPPCSWIHGRAAERDRRVERLPAYQNENAASPSTTQLPCLGAAGEQSQLMTTVRSQFSTPERCAHCPHREYADQEPGRRPLSSGPWAEQKEYHGAVFAGFCAIHAARSPGTRAVAFDGGPAGEVVQEMFHQGE